MFWPRVLRGWLRGRGRTITSVNTFQTTPRSGPKCRFGSRVCAGRDLRRRTPPDATARAAPASRCKTRRLAAPELPRCVRLQNQYRRVRVLDERDRRALRIDRRILVDASAGDDRFEATCLRFGANVIQTNRRLRATGLAIPWMANRLVSTKSSTYQLRKTALNRSRKSPNYRKIDKKT